MLSLFVISYILLCGLVGLQAMILCEILQRTELLNRSYPIPGGIHSQRVSSGSRSPDFSGRILGSDQTLRTVDLEGHFSVLIFVSPVEASSPLYTNLCDMIHAWWHRTGGHTYLVCNGHEEQCRDLARFHRVKSFPEDRIPVVLDEDAQIARSFFINDTPQAVELDSEVQVTVYGRPDIVDLAPE